MEQVAAAGARFRSITEAVDTTTSAGRMLMQMLGSFAEFERSMVRERTRAGLAAAREFVLNAVGESVPWINDSERLVVTEVQPNYWRGTAHFGFMEKPDIPAMLKQACAQNCSLNLSDVYYVGHGSIVPGDQARGLAKRQQAFYIAMERNSVHVSDFFRLPEDNVVLIGRRVAI